MSNRKSIIATSQQYEHGAQIIHAKWQFVAVTDNEAWAKIPEGADFRDELGRGYKHQGKRAYYVSDDNADYKRVSTIINVDMCTSSNVYVSIPNVRFANLEKVEVFTMESKKSADHPSVDNLVIELSEVEGVQFMRVSALDGAKCFYEIQLVGLGTLVLSNTQA